MTPTELKLTNRKTKATANEEKSYWPLSENEGRKMYK